MRKLIATLLILLAACSNEQPPQSFYTRSYENPLDTIVARIHNEYDLIRAERHNIPLTLATSIRRIATYEGIPLPLAFSLVEVESGFNSYALSSAGAIGLTQVMPATGIAHCGLAKKSLYDPDKNIACGFSYLKMLYSRYDRWDTALAAYNVGDARRKRAHLTGEPDGSSYARAVISGAVD